MNKTISHNKREFKNNDFSREAMQRLFPFNSEASSLKIECRRSDYCASAIARAVEDCDAHLLNLNVTAEPASDSDNVVVDLRVSHRNSAAVTRSLERYGYMVHDSEEATDDHLAVKARNNALELLHYLDN